MAVQDVTKPIAKDETLQATNAKIDALAKDLTAQALNTTLGAVVTALGLLGTDSTLSNKLQAIADAILNSSIMGNTDISQIADGTVTGAIAQFDSDISDLESDISGKVDKETGKGLSTNDFTNEDKALIGQTLGNNTVLTTDKTPFLIRQTLNPTGFSGYVREKLVGASYAWNQLVDSDFVNNYSKSNATVTKSGDTYTIEKVNSTWALVYKNESKVVVPSGHVLLAKIIGLSSNVYASFIKQTGNTSDTIINAPNGYVLYKPSFDVYGFGLYLGSNIASSVSFKTYEVIDLTLAFGSTIADYLYGLSNNGGITKLRDMGFPIDKYTPYGYGLYSVKTSAKRVKADINLPLKNQTRSQTGAISDINIRAISTYYDLKKGSLYRIMPSTSESGKTLRMSWQYWSNKSEGSNARLYDTGWITTFPVLITPEEDSIWTCVLSYSDESNVNISKVNVSASFADVDYPLGNDDLRGKFDLVNGEIVASGDVKESNGGITRKYGIVDLGTLTWTYNGGGLGEFAAWLSDSKASSSYTCNPNAVCAKYEVRTAGYRNANDKTIGVYDKAYGNGYIVIRDSAYTDAATFKTAMNGVYLIYELATPTTEQSTPFADPMSMVGATTEEYIDTRDIPCPVGAERQYMGQSEDVVEIPSTPQSDGVWVQKCYVSGGKAQYVWELESTL